MKPLKASNVEGTKADLNFHARSSLGDVMPQGRLQVHGVNLKSPSGPAEKTGSFLGIQFTRPPYRLSEFRVQ